MQSELGDVDRAVLEEAARKRRFLYTTASGTSTFLVEADEKPPHIAHKEAAPVILKYLVMHPDSSVEDAIQGCGFQSTGEEDIVQIVRRIVAERKDFVKE